MPSTESLNVAAFICGGGLIVIGGVWAFIAQFRRKK